jgi:exonuclease SbcC
MRPIRAHLVNFGSYKELDFEFQNQGLALIHGATGSGKSTIQDAIPWVLYGITAKGGTVDEIRSWVSPDKSTQGTFSLETPSGVIIVFRTRGKPSENDLYWIESDSTHQIRGKDITETQKLLDIRLGVTADQYIMAAYFNEFSITGNFFTSKPKARRELLENIADLTFPSTLSEKASTLKKETKIKLLHKEKQYERLHGKSSTILKVIQDLCAEVVSHEENRERIIKRLENESENFEHNKLKRLTEARNSYDLFEDGRKGNLYNISVEKQKLVEELALHPEVCDKCAQFNTQYLKLSKQIDSLDVKIEKISNEHNPHLRQLENITDSENTFTDALEIERNRKNPYKDLLISHQQNLDDIQKEIKELKVDMQGTTDLLCQLSQLQDLSSLLRSHLLLRSIKYLEDLNNRYLETYFDGEIRVKFTPTDTDKLDVELTKNGHECSYTQLSKGQRCMLKLCFSVAVMLASANKLGIHMSLLSFDEALDGLDENMKLKALGLFTELSLTHESVLVVEHSESLKSSFDNQYHVDLRGDVSYITKI